MKMQGCETTVKFGLNRDWDITGKLFERPESSSTFFIIKAKRSCTLRRTRIQYQPFSTSSRIPSKTHENQIRTFLQDHQEMPNIRNDDFSSTFDPAGQICQRQPLREKREV